MRLFICNLKNLCTILMQVACRGCEPTNQFSLTSLTNQIPRRPNYNRTGNAYAGFHAFSHSHKEYKPVSAILSVHHCACTPDKNAVVVGSMCEMKSNASCAAAS